MHFYPVLLFFIFFIVNIRIIYTGAQERWYLKYFRDTRKWSTDPSWVSLALLEERFFKDLIGNTSSDGALLKTPFRVNS